MSSNRYLGKALGVLELYDPRKNIYTQGLGYAVGDLKKTEEIDYGNSFDPHIVFAAVPAYQSTVISYAFTRQ